MWWDGIPITGYVAKCVHCGATNRVNKNWRTMTCGNCGARGPILNDADVKKLRSKQTILDAGTDNSIDKKGKQEIDETIYADIYEHINKNIRSNMVLKEKTEVVPCGWYKVLDESGMNDKVLIFEHQRIGYKAIAQNIEAIKQMKIIDDDSVKKTIDMYFDLDKGFPTLLDIKMILYTILSTDKMPDYFIFVEQKKIDARFINEQLKSLNKNESEAVYWLKDLYDKTPAIQKTYKTFFVFQKCVKNAEEIFSEYADCSLTK